MWEYDCHYNEAITEWNMAKEKKIETTSAVLLISCPDQRGIVATLTQWVSLNNGNVIHLDQHVDFTTNTFFMRIEWELDGFAIPRDALAPAFEPMGERFDMTWQLHFPTRWNAWRCWYRNSSIACMRCWPATAPRNGMWNSR